MKSDFQTMTMGELKKYVLEHRNDRAAFQALMDRGEYEMQQFRGRDRILSSAFPELQLTVNQIFNPGE